MSSQKPFQEQIDELKKQNELILRALEKAGMLKESMPEPIQAVRATPTFVEQPPPAIERTTPRESNIEENIGIRWFSWIGVITLVIGIGFFVKYAIDNNLVNHLARIIIGAGFGILLVAVGEYTSRKEKFRQWGKALVGGGLAIVYFVVYASYYFLEYRNAIGISQPLDIALLSVVALFTLYFSLKDSSQVIAGEAFLLGFITSLLAGDIQLLTLVYSAILALIFIIVVAYKQWPAIGLGGLFGSYLLHLLWNADGTQPFSLAFAFLTIYFFAYTAQTYLLMRRQESSLVIQGSAVAMVIANALFFGLIGYDLIRNSAPAYDAIFFACLSVFHLGLSYAAYSLRQSMLSITGFSTAVAFLAVAIAFQFQGAWMSVSWSALTVLLMLAWARKQYRTLLYLSCGLSLLTAVKVIFYDSWMLQSFELASSLQDLRPLAYIGMILSFVIAFYLLHKKNAGRSEEMVALHSYAWAFMVGGAFVATLELVHYSHMITLVWAYFASILLYLYFNKNFAELKYPGLALSGVLTCKILFFDSFLVETSGGLAWRIIAFAAGIIFFYGASFYLHARKQHLSAQDSMYIEAFSALGTVLSSLLILLELKEYWISIAWGGLGLLLLLVGFFQARKYLRYQGLVLFGFTILKVFLYDTRELPTLYRTISFLALGGLLIATSFIYSKYKDKLRKIL